MNKLLKDKAFFVTETINNQYLTSSNYISVDNLLPNRNGKCNAEFVPLDGVSIHYRKGDVLIGNIRPYFKKIWYADSEGGCSPDVLCIRAYDSSFSYYLYCYLSSDSFFDYAMLGSKGTKMPRGDKNHIMNFPIVCTKDFEEKGDFFWSINRKIELNQAINDNLAV